MTTVSRRILTAAAVGTALSLSAVFSGAVHAADAPAPSAEDETCLACHGQEGMSKTFGKDDSVSLHVDGKAFAGSVHGPLGCAACHADVDLKAHPGTVKSFDSARAFSIARAKVCGQCHEDKAKLFEGSVHARVLRTGNLAAPVCTDCHGAHAIVHVKAPSANDVACRKCHGAIFDAYLQSPHGKAYGKPGPMKAPICADCHRAHDVSPAATGTGLRDACLRCHTGAVEAHQKWLPNTKLHLQVVSCPACHAPTSLKRVDLRLYDPVAKRDVTAKEEQGRLEGPAGGGASGGTALDSKALWDLMRGVDRDGAPGRMTLVGRLEVRSGAEAHQLTKKGKAIRDCVVCHRKGADPFKNVTISIVGPDGRPIRYEAKQDVLHGPTSVEALSGFYAIGSTRIGVLDVLLALALLAGVSAPVVHLVLRRLLRRKQTAERSEGGKAE
jgi:Cytochrome c554 and c-prime